MDREKVVNELTNLPITIYDGFYQLRITHDLRNKVIALLEEQEAQSVLSNRVCKAEPTKYVRQGFCPACHQELEWLFNRKHCGFCGQAVKWE